MTAGVIRNLLGWLLTLFVAFNCAAQTPNIGFEDGTFNNWECWTGTIDSYGAIHVLGNGQVAGRQTIINSGSTPAVDLYGKFPTLCPNGSKYSIQLGNNLTGAEAEGVNYTLVVPPGGTYTVLFNYAVVLEDPGHQDYQQPKFTAMVYDVTDGIYIDCPKFNFVSSSSLPGFQLSDLSTTGDQIFYKPWSTAIIDLTFYHGKTMRIEFATNDCTLGAHFGYAYLDVEDSNSSQPISGNAYCSTQNSVTLVGPTGFEQYTWLSGKTKIGQGEKITLPAPPDQTVIGLEVIPYGYPDCVDTLYTTISKINAGFVLKTQDTLYACVGQTADITASAISAGSDAGLKYSYYSDSLATVYAYNPTQITADGKYYIKAVSAEGCTGISPVYVKFGLPKVKITDPAAVIYPATVDITKAPAKTAGISFSYFTDSAATIPIDDPAKIKATGTYYVQLTSSFGCQNVLAIHVVVNPPLQFILSAPNVFTPNGDGVNDLFQFSIHGYLDFGNVKVYGRNGQLLFMFKTIDQTWDGTYGGKQLPAGVYYWVFEGTDSYYHTKVTRSGSITIIR